MPDNYLRDLLGAAKRPPEVRIEPWKVTELHMGRQTYLHPDYKDAIDKLHLKVDESAVLALKRHRPLEPALGIDLSEVSRFHQPRELAPIVPGVEPPVMPMPEPWVDNSGSPPADRPDNPYYLQG